MFDKVLVPLDGSKLAEQSLPYARVFAKGLGARIALLRVCEPVDPDLGAPVHGQTYGRGVASGLTYPVDAPEVTHGQHLDQDVASIKTIAQDYLEKVAAPLRDEGIAVTCTVGEGRAPQYIVEEAQKEPNTVTAMSTHGRLGIARWTLGSVTDKVLHNTTVPLLTIRASDDGDPTRHVRLTRVIAPLDESAEAETVLPTVAALARELDLSVCLVNVHLMSGVDTNYASLGHGSIVQEVDDKAEAYLGRVAERLEDEGVSSVDGRVRHGSVAQSIIDVASEPEGGLVVMSTHGRAGLSHWMMGSVTDKVVRQCDVPVIVIRPGEEAVRNRELG